MNPIDPTAVTLAETQSARSAILSGAMVGGPEHPGFDWSTESCTNAMDSYAESVDRDLTILHQIAQRSAVWATKCH